MAPRPGPPPAPQRWFQERTSEYPWEQDGLDHIKRLMPAAEPFRAFATFSFTAASGRIHECDLLIAVPGGLYLLELKGHPGAVENHGDTWTFRERGNPRSRTLINPLHFTDSKSKELKNRLEWAARRLKIKVPVPRVEPAIFLSDKGLRSHLDDVQKERVYGRDGSAVGVPWVWRDLLSKPPHREQHRLRPEFSRALPLLLKEMGVRASTAHLRFGDDWTLRPELLDAGPMWEDRLAERHGLVDETGRVRIYLTGVNVEEERRRSIERAARREYQVLQGITHRGIAQAVEIREHQSRPAILFRHGPSDLRLDSYLAVHAQRLDHDTRRDLVHQLAEAVQYAHSRSLFHRALAARSVYVTAGEDGSSPVLRVIDWQAAARDFEQTVSPSLGITSLGTDYVADAADLYLAPEFTSPFPDPVDLDVFGLGAIAFHILTGQPPAASRGALIEQLAAEGGLHPYGVASEIADDLDALVFHATRSDPAERLDSAEAFLLALDATDKQAADPEPQVEVDPLTATAGELVDGEWEVARVLGSGATARAILVIRPDEADETIEARVLKVALDEEKAANLVAEGRILDLVGGGTIVKKLAGPRQLGNRTVLDLQYGGGEDLDAGSLGSLLRAQGGLTYHQLERFGDDLFTALDHLAGQGIRHRDVKPDNLAVFERKDRSKQLLLLDFSAATASERDITAGTLAYLDPFLGTPRRPVYDDYAERYAAAVTLHEMAANDRPIWGDGMTDPRTTADPLPTISASLFEPALRDELVAFFGKALHREVDQRHDSLPEMRVAWREVFAVSDAATPASTPGTVDLDAGTVEETRDASALAATRDTPLEASGLSPRAVSVAQSFDATTVGELLDVPLHQIARARGAGAVIRKEINRRHKQWAAQLAVAALPGGPDGEPFTVDEMVGRLVPETARRGSRKIDVARLTLALPGAGAVPPPWTSQTELARLLGITQTAVSKHQQSLYEGWAGVSWLTRLRDELVELVAGAGRVSTVPEVAAAVRARRGSALADHAAALASATAIVRAAVETEVWSGMNSDDEAVSGPRLAVLRRGGAVLIVLESLPGTDAPSAADLADYAHQLGEAADVLCVADPMPGRGTVVTQLRAVVPPEGMAPLADTRVVALAAAASRAALVSPRLELYPRGLDLVTALRTAQAGAGVRRLVGITVEDLLGRVRSRFPEVTVPDGLTHVGMQEALRDAGFGLQFDLERGRFLPPPTTGHRPPTSRTNTSLAGVYSGALDAHHAMHVRLTAAVDRGGFRALTLRGKHLPGAAEALARAYRVRAVDVNGLYLEELRALVAERGQDWGKVLAADVRFTETGELAKGLASYVGKTWERVGERLAELGDATEVLFLHDADLLGRYADAGGRELLVGLQAAARNPVAAPHGLWVLCPGDSATGTPHLDDMVVERIDGSESVVLIGDFITELRSPSGSAA